jgi:hypothetical protein
MSEAIEVQNEAAPQEKKGTANRGTNFRKALAGFHLTQGMTQAEALMASGYSPLTATNPTKNGLHAEPCIAEWERFANGSLPAIMLRDTRAIAHAAILSINPQRQQALALRAWDLAERHHGGREGLGAGGDRVPAGVRIGNLTVVLAQMQARGMVRPQHVVVEGDVIEGRAEKPLQDNESELTYHTLSDAGHLSPPPSSLLDL